MPKIKKREIENLAGYKKSYGSVPVLKSWTDQTLFCLQPAIVFPKGVLVITILLFSFPVISEFY